MRLVVAALLAAIILSLGIYSINDSYTDAGIDNTQTNETWIPNTGTAVTLSQSNEANNTYCPSRDITVYDLNSTKNTTDDFKVPQNGNWTWIDTNGTIITQGGGELDGDPNASITYCYQTSTNRQRTLSTAIASLTGLAPAALPFVFFIAIILLAMRVM